MHARLLRLHCLGSAPALFANRFHRRFAVAVQAAFAFGSSAFAIIGGGGIFFALPRTTSDVALMEPVIWAGLLLLLGLALVMLEIFVPTGGLLGFLSLTAILVGIGLAFWHGGLTYGFSFLLVSAVAVPVVLSLAFRWLPGTPIGRRILPALPNSRDVLPDSEERRMLRGLVGKIGHAKSTMLPSGAVVVEGRTIDAVSEGMPIEMGEAVRVIEVRGTRVVVRPLDADAEDRPPSAPDDPLSRPIDTLGIDPFDDPLV